jgi:D-tyrosyl-tRNA(Tyr) deacylase
MQTPVRAVGPVGWRRRPGPWPSRFVEELCNALRRRGAHVETGIFGAHMDVESVNDGPVTVILDVPQDT